MLELQKGDYKVDGHDEGVRVFMYTLDKDGCVISITHGVSTLLTEADTQEIRGAIEAIFDKHARSLTTHRKLNFFVLDTHLSSTYINPGQVNYRQASFFAYPGDDEEPLWEVDSVELSDAACPKNVATVFTELIGTTQLNDPQAPPLQLSGEIGRTIGLPFPRVD